MNEFHFRTTLDQTVLLGRKAKNVHELLEGIEAVPDSSIYYHTHRFLQQHHFLSPEPPNDFAYWISEVINDDRLAEAVASIDVVQFHSLAEVRNAFVRTIRENEDPDGKSRLCPAGGEFHFMASRTFVLSTPYSAADLGGFLDALKRVSVGSLYYHIFEAKLRLGKGENDFSRWFRDGGLPELADRVARLDPYSYTLEGLRNEILKLGNRYVKN